MEVERSGTATPSDFAAEGGQHHGLGVIPFKILKSGVFDLKSCRALILNKLRVLSLLRQNQQHRMHIAAAHCDSVTNIDRRFPNSHAAATSAAMATTNAYNSLAALIDFESTALVRALGSLLSYLQDTTFRMEEGSTVTVNAVTYAKSANFMRIDATTLHSLHIFSTEHHPLIAKGSGNAKEGFSLFTLLDRCRSKIGRQCLREWMLKPVLDPIEISRRQGE
jgi:DNA mismatch repair ATPase MutS